MSSLRPDVDARSHQRVFVASSQLFTSSKKGKELVDGTSSPRTNADVKGFRVSASRALARNFPHSEFQCFHSKQDIPEK